MENKVSKKLHFRNPESGESKRNFMLEFISNDLKNFYKYFLKKALKNQVAFTIFYDKF